MPLFSSINVISLMFFFLFHILHDQCNNLPVLYRDYDILCIFDKKTWTLYLVITRPLTLYIMYQDVSSLHSSMSWSDHSEQNVYSNSSLGCEVRTECWNIIPMIALLDAFYPDFPRKESPEKLKSAATVSANTSEPVSAYALRDLSRSWPGSE